MSDHDAMLAGARTALANGELMHELVTDVLRQLNHGDRPPVGLIALRATADQLEAAVANLRNTLVRASRPGRPGSDSARLETRLIRHHLVE